MAGVKKVQGARCKAQLMRGVKLEELVVESPEGGFLHIPNHSISKH